MLTLDENGVRDLVARGRVAQPPRTWPHVFECLERHVRVDILPLGRENTAWLNYTLTKGMSDATKAKVAEDAPPVELDFVARCHIGADEIAHTRIAGWAVQAEPGGAFVEVAFTPKLCAMLLHQLIDAPTGLQEYLRFTAALTPDDEKEPDEVDPTATAGNSSGV